LRHVLLTDYRMLLVLVLIAGYFSFATLTEQYPTGADAARQVVALAERSCGRGASVVIVAESGEEALAFSDAAEDAATAAGLTVDDAVVGEPPEVAHELDRLTEAGTVPAAIVTTRAAAQWPLFAAMPERYPALARTPVISPVGHVWPSFLRRSNLLAIADRIVVIAIVAIGMTMVIITGGIDLSVGSLIALSAVVSTVLIRDLAGGASASAGAMALCCVAGAVLCGCVGLVSGSMVTFFLVPPFIVTLTMMLVASGLAFTLSGGQSVYDVPASIDRLGRGAAVFGIPNTIALMAVLYAVAHVVMTRTRFGRYLYAVGGNREASRLSGVPIAKVILVAYAICGCLAGLGGIVQASQLQSGAPTYGVMYELYVIAAVVLGGTSLMGGQGRVLGTLVGALVIAVIQNGMNLTGVESYTQKVVLGAVILAAVLLDVSRTRGRFSPSPRRESLS